MTRSFRPLWSLLVVCAGLCCSAPETDYRKAPQATALEPGRKKQIVHLSIHAQSFPEALKGYSRLRILNIKGLKENPPEFLRDMQSLRILGFYESDLPRFPTPVLGLHGLEELYLMGVDVSVMPAEIDSLRSLKILSISSKTLTSLGDGIPRLSRLERLEVRTPALQSLPQTLARMSSLKSVEIWDSQLTELDPELFRQGRKVELYRGRFSTGAVKVGLLPVRESPEITARGVATLRQGQEVRILKRTGKTMTLQGQSGEWLFIWPGSCGSPCRQVGYVFSGFLQ
ncbi:MAG: leucine-rich repeat domain-containing protein [Spirochaetales bacterium]|nr:leucine-rich repeat domain-containing protein [Spirochaetales bacterium]